MLERLRQHQGLRAVVSTVLVLAWLVALAAGVPARSALASSDAVDLCTTAVTAPNMHGHAMGDGDGDGGHGAAHGHGPDCVLCITLSAPFSGQLAVARSPAPPAYAARRPVALKRPAWRALAPLPARGPPVARHA